MSTNTDRVTMLGPSEGADRSKDEIAQILERSGLLAFEVVANDGNIRSLEMLLGVKNIFCRQLPKMPGEYISGLVFDKNHRTCIAFYRPSDERPYTTVGGICFRPFAEQGFIEIVFVAVESNEQVKGFGTRLMNQVKHYSQQSMRIFRFLTYADNSAKGFFKKFGFSKKITLSEDRYKGCIKDYDGATLMECVLRPEPLCYLAIPDMIREQRRALFAEIKRKQIGSKNGHMTEYEGMPADGRPEDIEAIPGIKGTSWKPMFNEKQLADMANKFRLIHDALVKDEQLRDEISWPFLEPVDAKEVPDYYQVITEPIDLQEIGRRLDRGFYRTPHIFHADIKRMCENCKTYNSEDSEYYQCAMKVYQYCKDRLVKYGFNVRFE